MLSVLLITSFFPLSYTFLISPLNRVSRVEYTPLIFCLSCKKIKISLQAYHRAHEIQTVVRRLNRYCAQQEWNINISVPGILVIEQKRLDFPCFFSFFPPKIP